MKTQFISHLVGSVVGDTVDLFCWIQGRRNYRKVTFYDLVDSTGNIQAVVSADVVGERFSNLSRFAVGSSVHVGGSISEMSGGSVEITVESIHLVGGAKNISPALRRDDEIFALRLTDHALRNRHLYIRNERLMSILKARHLLMGAVHQWFRQNGFVEITAPVLTALPLYDDGSAISVEIDGEKVYLTQCVGYYLESAVHAFERVYNLGPSFRGEESRSKRHLMEYWHIKAEIAFANREDMISIVEALIQHLTVVFQSEFATDMETIGTELCLDGLDVPFPRISYRGALELLREKGQDVEFGRSISSDDEAVISGHFHSPVWIVGNPRSIEPFPYVLDPDDTDSTMTADLIASRGYGELLGVAEKIFDLSQLDERMLEKGKAGRLEYEWLRELREHGCVPHSGIGMGLERLLRWLIQIDHVRDAMPFPRTFRRRVYP